MDNMAEKAQEPSKQGEETWVENIRNNSQIINNFIYSPLHFNCKHKIVTSFKFHFLGKVMQAILPGRFSSACPERRRS